MKSGKGIECDLVLDHGKNNLLFNLFSALSTIDPKERTRKIKQNIIIKFIGNDLYRWIKFINESLQYREYKPSLLMC